MSQVVAPSAPAPSSAGTSTQGSAGANSGTQQGNNSPQNANLQSNPQGNNAKISDAKNAANADTQTQDGGDQSKQNQKTSATLSPEEQAKLQLRSKIYGYSIFADKNFNPIPDFQIVTPLNYVVGPGDQLNVYLYNYAEATYELLVNRDGFITIPRVGNVYVAGRTIEEVRKILIDKFAKFTPGLLGTGGETAKTKLMVTLGETRTVKVFVTGEVINPGAYEISSMASAFNALYLAGGPNEIGSFRDVRVVRGGKTVSHLDIYDFLSNGKIDGDIRVQDNDNIIVGYYLKRVEVAGQVKRPGLFELKTEEKLGDALQYAGGFADKAYRGRVKIQRITSRERRIIDIPEEEYKTFEMATGDSVSVETILDRFDNIVTIEGAVMRPGNYALENSPSLKKLIDNAQGLREDAFVGRINVLRTRTDLTIENISLNYSDILNNTVPDLMLARLDQIIVPSKFEMAQSSYISVEGEVNNPKVGENEGKFAYTANMTLEDALLLAGGLKESAYSTEVEVVRRKRNSIAGAANAQIAEVFKFDVNRDLTLNSKESNFVLYPFDQIIVRKSPNYVEQQSVFVEGEVLVSGPFSIINKNDKISDIIKRAGGLTELAYPEGATLLRRTVVKSLVEPTNFEAEEMTEKSIKKGTIIGDQANVKEESIGIKLKSILRNPGSFEDLVVQEGDIIRIPKRLETVQVNGQVLYPTTVKYGKGLTFIDYISQSGGFTTTSLRKSSYVKYPNGNIDRTRRFMFFNVYPKVEPGSEITVPTRAAPSLTPQAAIQTTTSVLGSIMSLILAVLAFRSIN
ncbi:polysaccharide biosynthesis/export family protein [Dyadobacter helix]|uniref:polysaccharide biosynthesis/export family protein n=1 Tax=Dyadobacter helix TaxID=2822344 RepID=UPI001E5C6077|nr:SLBB domain-containing protein [Dyadobacter sp. CECT 9275]